MSLGMLAPCLIFLALFFAPTGDETKRPYAYMAPRPGATLVSAATTIGVRPGPALAEDTIDAGRFRVRGSTSGEHSGQARLASDGRTVIFQPVEPFAPGETVTVDISPGMMTTSGASITGVSYSFTISPKPIDSMADEPRLPSPELYGIEHPASVEFDRIADPIDAAGRRYQTLPADFPAITVTVNLEEASDDSIFLMPVPTRWGALILDSDGEPVYYRPRPFNAIDFKKQPNGQLSYFDFAQDEFHILDNTYTQVGTVRAGNGYTIDEHDLQILDNGNYLFLIYDPQPVDMSQIVPGGQPTATVAGLVIQELDVEENVVFEWRSWDHIPITDSYVDLTAGEIDYVHGNSIEADSDGHLLLSSRHLNEVTKIDRQTGDIIWRLGGKANQFTFVGDEEGGFRIQHDARRQANGNLTLFDNHGPAQVGGRLSRAVEYRLDEEAMTAELVWSYRNTPDTFALAMGNTQRLPNGHTVIGWGTGLPTMTEVTPDQRKVYELTLEPTLRSYRVFRFPWQGFPAHPPTLITRIEEGDLALYYSWNGATEVASYRIYGGRLAATELVDVQSKTGFENKTLISAGEESQAYCMWQVMPVDRNGEETILSNPAFAAVGDCTQIFLPIMGR